MSGDAARHVNDIGEKGWSPSSRSLTRLTERSLMRLAEEA